MSKKPDYCACKHAVFAHKGDGHQDAPQGCNLCQCKGPHV